MLTADTVKLTPLLDTPFAVTTTLPVVAPVGTDTTMLVSVQLEGAAEVPLNATVLVPWVEPKPEPAIVTDAPAVPELGDRLLMLGLGSTVNDRPLLSTPLACTTTLPVVAPLGTATTICVSLQLVGVAVTPLNATVLAP